MQKNKLASTKAGSKVIKKTVVRGVDVPLKESQQRRTVVHLPTKLITVSEEQVYKTSSSTATAKSQINDKNKSTKTSHKPKSLHTPILNSVDNLIKNIDNLNLNPSVKVENLTPKSKTIVTQEVTKKLNFPYDKPIYKDLISIESDDSNSMSDHINSARSRRLVRDKYLKSDKKKDPIPELKDFLSPVKRIEIEVPLYTRQDNLKCPNINLYNKVHEIVTNHVSYSNSIN